MHSIVSDPESVNLFVSTFVDEAANDDVGNSAASSTGDQLKAAGSSGQPNSVSGTCVGINKYNNCQYCKNLHDLVCYFTSHC